MRTKVSENFYRDEFACDCECGFDAADAELLRVLEDVRFFFNRPVIISGPNRCVTHNRNVKGAQNSIHTKGMAADFKVLGIHPDKVANYLEEKYTDKYGIGRYVGRTHVDVRPNKARWDKR